MALRECSVRGLRSCLSALERSAVVGTSEQTRHIGTWVPEYFGKKSKYSEGTDFLGTPADHLKRVNRRPISPDVFDIDNKGLHYKLPIQAIASITTRVTGVAMSVGVTSAGVIALTGDLPGTISYLKACGPLVTLPLKTLVAFPIVYHYVAGVRHLLWDHHSIPAQADKNSMLELDEVRKSSEAVLYGSAAITALLALYYYTG